MDFGSLSSIESFSSLLVKPEPADMVMVEDLEQIASQNIRLLAQADRQKRMKRKFVGSREMSDSEAREHLRKTRFRFRLLVRLLVLYPTTPEHDHLYYDKLAEDEKGITVFNVNAFKRVRQYFFLSPLVKRMMLKPYEFRADDEVDAIYNGLTKLSFLEKYSQQTQRDMARYSMYNFVSQGRTVVRQGDLPVNFYFVLSGNLAIHVEEKDAISGDVISKPVGELKAGDSFGHKALAHNAPRTATVFSKLPSELLSLHKDDFNQLLKSNVKHEWQMRYNSLLALKYFASWTIDQIYICCNNCSQKRFISDQLIIGNVKERPESMYFIIGGHCRVVEVLHVISHKRTPFTRAFNLQVVPICNSKENIKLDSWSNIVKRYIHIMTLEKGQYFGAGEDLRRRYIISWGKVECIEIPHLFLRRNDHSDWVELLQDTLQMQLPSHEYVFQEFVERASWRAYKQRLFQDTMKLSNKPLSTTIDDVPISIRQAEEAENWITIQS